MPSSISYGICFQISSVKRSDLRTVKASAFGEPTPALMFRNVLSLSALSNPFNFTALAGQTGPVRHLQEKIDLKELARRLSRTFPDLVTVSDSANTITVMGRIRVTSEGIAEGSGPVADRVKTIFEEYVREQSREQASNPASPRKEGKVRNPFRCQHCGLRLTSGRVYRRTIGGSVMLFCCKQCADHEEAELVKPGAQ